MVQFRDGLRTGPCPLLSRKAGEGWLWDFYGCIYAKNIVDFGTDEGELVYVRAKGNATTGSPTITALRGRVESASAANAALSVRGLHAQAQVNESLYSKNVTAIYAESMARASSSLTTLRAIEATADIYNSTTVTNVAGIEVGVRHPTTAITVSGYDTLLRLYLDGSNNHQATSAIEIDTPTAAMKLGCLIDASEANLGVVNTDQVVLFKFKNASGTAKSVIYDASNAGVLEVV